MTCFRLESWSVATSGELGLSFPGLVSVCFLTVPGCCPSSSWPSMHTLRRTRDLWWFLLLGSQKMIMTSAKTIPPMWWPMVVEYWSWVRQTVVHPECKTFFAFRTMQAPSMLAASGIWGQNNLRSDLSMSVSRWYIMDPVTYIPQDWTFTPEQLNQYSQLRAVVQQ